MRAPELPLSVRHMVLASVTAPDMYAGSSGPEETSQPASQGKAARKWSQLFSDASASATHTFPTAPHAAPQDTPCVAEQRRGACACV